MSTVNTFGQAGAWISIPIITIIYSDTFTRTTSAPPFDMGSSDTGQLWKWSGWDSSFTSQTTSTTHVDGSTLLIGSGTGSVYDSFYGPPYVDQADVYFDFWIPVSGQNNQDIRYYDKNWYLRLFYSTDSVYSIGGSGGSGTYAILRSTWYRVHAQVNSAGNGDGSVVRAHIWKVGDSEPGTWTTLQTSWPYSAGWDGYNDGFTTINAAGFDIYYTTDTESTKIDNLSISAAVLSPFNEGMAQAQADIKATIFAVAQAQASVNQVWKVGQVQADIKQIYSISGQSQAFISKSKGLANAQARIYPAPGTYQYRVFSDGAVAYYNMDNVATNVTIYDANSSYNMSNNYSYYNYTTTGYVSPSKSALRWYYYNYASNSGTPSVTNNSTWSVELWINPQSTTRIPIWQTGISSPNYLRISIHYGSPSAGQQSSSGTHFYVAEQTNSASTTYDGGNSFSSSTWHQVVLTSNGTSRNLYVDGILQNSWTGLNTSTWTGVYQNIGYDYYWGTRASGDSIRDDWAVYNVELSPTQVANHYTLADFTRFSYGQAQASINRVWQTGQATVEIGAGAGGIFLWNRQASSLATIAATSKKSAQAKAQILTFGNNKFAQARALIQPDDGLVSGIWSGGQSNEAGVGSWYSENTRNNPAYYSGGGPTPPGYPGNNNWGMMSAGTFVADETGPWLFGTATDDGSLIRIQGDSIPGSAVTGQFSISGKVATMNNNYGGGQGQTYRSGTVYLTAGKLYTIQFKGGQGGGDWSFHAYFARPYDTYLSYLTDGGPWMHHPADVINDTFVKGMAQAYISPSFNQPRFAQAQSDIKAKTFVFAQAQTQIGSRVYGQAIAQITYNPESYRRAVLLDKPILYFPLDETSGDIQSIVGRAVTVWSAAGATYSQSSPVPPGVGIKFNGTTSTVSLLGTRTSVTDSGGLTFPGYDSGPYTGIGGAANILAGPITVGAGHQLNILLTSAMSSGGNVGVFTGLTTNLADVVENLWENGTVGLHSFTSSYTYAWIYSYYYTGGKAGAGTWSITLPTSGDPLIPTQVGTAVTLEFWMKWDGTNDSVLIQNTYAGGIYFYGGNWGFTTTGGNIYGQDSAYLANTWKHVAIVWYNGQTPDIANKIYVDGALQSISQVRGPGQIAPTFTPQTLVIGGYTSSIYTWYGTLDEFAVFDYELSGAQILAHFQSVHGVGHAQAQAYISPSFNQPRFAQSQARILRAYRVYAQANAYILPRTGIGRAQARIFAFNVDGFAQAQASILTLGNVVGGQSQAFIKKSLGNANALSTIKTNYSYVGFARAAIGHFARGYAQAYIIQPSRFAQAQANILGNAYQIAYTTALIDDKKRKAQAQATIITTYQGYAQAGALYAQAFGLAQANAWIIVRDIPKMGQSQARIKQIYQGLGQALALNIINQYRNAQSQAFITVRHTNSGQAATQIGFFKYAQAQARIISFDVQGFGTASAYILVDITVIPVGPTSDRQSYLIRFNNYTLPGYAQSESLDSIIRISDAK